MPDDPVLSALKNDFAAALEAFDSHDFALMNVMANRLMATVLFSPAKHGRYSLPGFLVKTLAIELGQLPTEGHETDEVLDAADGLLNQIRDMFDDKCTAEQAWKAYEKYHGRARLMRTGPQERKAYQKENPAFTTLAVDYIFRESLPDIDTLCRVDGGIVPSSLSEIERAVRLCGCVFQDLALYSLLISFSRIFDYRYFEAMPPTGNFDSDGMKAKIKPTLEALLTFYKDVRHDPEVTIERGTKLLEDFVLEWRALFLKYAEIGRAQQQQARRPTIQLPEAAREQITESLKRAIQDDVSQQSRPAPRKESRG
jgi:hypothetical protein